METSSILLYSKYSNHCKNFNELLEKSNLDIPFIPLCIDNKKIRQQIQSNTKIVVNSVPCIINLYNNGSVELYEADQAFFLLNDIISQYTQQDNNSVIDNDTQKSPPSQKVSSQDDLSRTVSSRTAASNESVFDGRISSRAELSGRKATFNESVSDGRIARGVSSQDDSQQVQNKNINGTTSLEDLFTDNEDDEEQANEDEKDLQKDKKLMIRTDKGNYDIIENTQEISSDLIDNSGISKQIKDDSESGIKPSNNINMMAQELAKSRELDDDMFQKNNKGLPPNTRIL